MFYYGKSADGQGVARKLTVGTSFSGWDGVDFSLEDLGVAFTHEFSVEKDK